MNKTLPYSLPIQQGVDPAAVARCLKAIQKKAGQELHSIMILRNGSIIAEGCWRPYRIKQPTMLFSLSKSFTSTAIGFAVAEGRLSVDDRVLDFFPDKLPANRDKYWSDLKVRHLLSMNTGHDQDTTSAMVMRPDGDWVQAFFEQPIAYPPGSHFLYNTGATYILSVLIQKVTGQRLLDYLQSRLFDALGITGATWDQSPQGYDAGGFGLNLVIEDIARFGQFLLQRGKWEGQQLLPAAWVDEATRVHSDNSINQSSPDWRAGYGYQFWRCVPDCYRGDGAFGQYCIVIPQLAMVIAITSGVKDMQAVLTAIWKHLLPGVDSNTTDIRPRNKPTAHARLQKLLAEAAYEPPVVKASSEIESKINGKTWCMEKNDAQLESIQLNFLPDSVELILSVSNQHVKVSFGRGCWQEGVFTGTIEHGVLPRNNMPVATSFTWLTDDSLQLTIRDLGSPFVMTYLLKLHDNVLTFASSVNLSFGPTEQPVIQGCQKA